MHTDLQIDISLCRHIDDMPVETACLWGETPVTLRALRRLDDGTLRSAQIDLPAGWSGRFGSGGTGTVQLFVRSGALAIEGQRLSANAFLVLHGDAGFAAEAVEPCVLLAIFDANGTGAPNANERLVIPDVHDIPWSAPVIDGKRLDGFEGRTLWKDPVTGADTRFLRVPAGFRGGGPNWHPVHEEIFCLEGDIQPDETRPMRAGSFLWNPARAIHGFDEHTVAGTVLLEWHDGPWALTFARDARRPER